MEISFPVLRNAQSDVPQTFEGDTGASNYNKIQRIHDQNNKHQQEEVKVSKNVSSLYRLESYNAESYPTHINTVRSRDTEKLSFADEVASKPLVA